MVVAYLNVANLNKLVFVFKTKVEFTYIKWNEQDQYRTLFETSDLLSFWMIVVLVNIHLKGLPYMYTYIYMKLKMTANLQPCLSRYDLLNVELG
jgi:hypothetical protein